MTPLEPPPMATTQLYDATNRHHRGRDRWKPTGYGPEPSEDGTENLRFGLVTIGYDHAKVTRYLEDDCGFESDQPRGKLGSSRAFSKLQAKMNSGDHVLNFVHGPNMNWWQAVASTLSLQCMLN